MGRLDPTAAFTGCEGGLARVPAPCQSSSAALPVESQISGLLFRYLPPGKNKTNKKGPSAGCTKLHKNTGFIFVDVRVVGISTTSTPEIIRVVFHRKKDICSPCFTLNLLKEPEQQILLCCTLLRPSRGPVASGKRNKKHHPKLILYCREFIHGAEGSQEKKRIPTIENPDCLAPWKMVFSLPTSGFSGSNGIVTTRV